MSKQEFAYCWNSWIKKVTMASQQKCANNWSYFLFQIVRPVSALIVVDVQNDFISGSLSISRCPAGHDGEEVIHSPLRQIFTSSCNAHKMDIQEASSTKSLLSTILSDHGSFCFHRILSLSCSNNVPIFGSVTKRKCSGSYLLKVLLLHPKMQDQKYFAGQKSFGFSPREKTTRKCDINHSLSVSLAVSQRSNCPH